jgi:ABC-type multidrug transport system permease subunit
MDNEFKRIDLACEYPYITPYGPGYPAELGPNQVCTLAGSAPGNPSVPGRDYIYQAFRYDISHQWRNWVCLRSIGCAWRAWLTGARPAGYHDRFLGRFHHHSSDPR